MYKVFVNDKPIIITISPQRKDGFATYAYKNAVLEEVLHKISSPKYKGILLFSIDLETDWKHFLSHFKIITAGGGLVLNSKKEILFIYRGNRWDLPKGRIEKGESIEETAIREVEEECGISNLTITQFLLKTYHVFYFEKERRLKETYWYLMNSDYKGTLHPQLEEGITKVAFKAENDAKTALKDSYGNIHLVYETYKDIS